MTSKRSKERTAAYMQYKRMTQDHIVLRGYLRTISNHVYNVELFNRKVVKFMTNSMVEGAMKKDEKISG